MFPIPNRSEVYNGLLFRHQTTWSMWLKLRTAMIWQTGSIPSDCLVLAPETISLGRLSRETAILYPYQTLSYVFLGTSLERRVGTVRQMIWATTLALAILERQFLLGVAKLVVPWVYQPASSPLRGIAQIRAYVSTVITVYLHTFFIRFAASWFLFT